jgi:hypothetical protein
MTSTIRDRIFRITKIISIIPFVFLGLWWFGIVREGPSSDLREQPVLTIGIVFVVTWVLWRAVYYLLWGALRITIGKPSENPAPPIDIKGGLKKNYPAVVDQESALRAASLGANFSYALAAVMLSLGGVMLFLPRFRVLGSVCVIYGAAQALTGWAIGRKLSRAAAVFQFLLIWGWAFIHGDSFLDRIFMLLSIFSVNAIRGTFASYRFKQNRDSQLPSDYSKKLFWNTFVAWIIGIIVYFLFHVLVR